MLSAVMLNVVMLNVVAPVPHNLDSFYNVNKSAPASNKLLPLLLFEVKSSLKPNSMKHEMFSFKKSAAI
jgi:hypothetical protein